MLVLAVDDGHVLAGVSRAGVVRFPLAGSHAGGAVPSPDGKLLAYKHFCAGEPRI